MMSDNEKTVSEALNEVEEMQADATQEASEAEDFSQLLQENDQAIEKKSFERGMIVEGVIVQIGAEYAYVNIGSKAEASIPVSELLNPEDGKLTHVIGDVIKAKVIGFDGSGVKLSRSLKSGNIALEEAYQAGCAVRARVKAVNKGGFELELMGQRAFCPLSQIQRGKIEDPNAFVGESFDFKIIKYAKKKRDIVLSRTALLEEENKLKRDEVLSALKPGMVLDAKVVSLQDYGAFVDVGGVDGLVHVSEISYKHIRHPKELLNVGQDVKAVVLALEETPKGHKLSLSMKRLEDDPFTAALSELSTGARVTGVVVRNANFGTFVELAPGVEGLIHISELSWDRHLKHADDVVKAGDKIEVTVLGVDPETRRISLSYKEAASNPWASVSELYSVGQEVSGTLDSVTDFGIFVKLPHHMTALLPMSELGEAGKSLSTARRGTPITAKIILIDADRKRITLSTRPEGESQAPRKRAPRREDAHEGEERRSRSPKNTGDSNYNEATSFGSLGDVLAGLKKK